VGQSKEYYVGGFCVFGRKKKKRSVERKNQNTRGYPRQRGFLYMEGEKSKECLNQTLMRKREGRGVQTVNEKFTRRGGMARGLRVKTYKT